MDFRILKGKPNCKDGDDALSIANNNISQLLDNNKELEASKELVQKELEKSMKEANAKIVEFENVFAHRKSIEDALSLAEKNVLVLKNEKEESLLGKDVAESKL
ncbi:hypothetical protein CQW23_26390 [Capsicum baccatum]|uniref:Uncharacterized protein n=1 Tax=Capsicum baccatum TaxID=33114 RepID=A0A2G2VNN1_CAPBA|nr:hypothetical protein CQW23_26390 [Capsicum baccatum]